MFVRLTLLTCLQILSLVGALVFYLLRIVNALEKIGGAADSDLAKIRYGVRAIETETGHLAPQVTKLNQGLLALAGKLGVVDGQLAAVANTLAGPEEKEMEKALWNRGVAAIWSGMLAATVFAVVPIAVTLLTRALNAARQIEQYTAEILTSGVGIAENTANVVALKDTIAAAPHLVIAATSLEANTARIEAALASKVISNGNVEGGKI